jgi:amidase
VFGRTLNPQKLCLNVGGSSSGEGALVGFRASILGVGSDIGGSIRVPSLCCGCFGFKPTAGRIPWEEQAPLVPKGWVGIKASVGPHATSARDLTHFCKTVIQRRPWEYDSTALMIPWRDVPVKSSLRIGVWADDAEFPVFPPVARILKAAVDRLRDAGHTVEHIEKPPQLLPASRLAVRSYALDTVHNAQKFLAAAEENPVDELIELQGKLLAGADGPAETMGLAEANLVNCGIDDYREEWARIWFPNRFDVVICPGARGTGSGHGKFGAPAWTAVWNLLDVMFSVPHRVRR